MSTTTDMQYFTLRNMETLRFKSTSKAPVCLFSNLYGNVEIHYIFCKFSNPKVKTLIQSWLHIYNLSEMNEIRYKLEKCKVDKYGHIVPKGGKSGLLYTPKQNTTYCCEFDGKTYIALGILAKLAAATWQKKNHRHRINVLKVLSGISSTDTLGNTIPNHEDMWYPLRQKYTKEPFKSLLKNTKDLRLAEMDGRQPNEWTDTGGNRLEKMLMEIRKEI